jgi:hypothetical protein
MIVGKQLGPKPTSRVFTFCSCINEIFILCTRTDKFVPTSRCLDEGFIYDPSERSTEFSDYCDILLLDPYTIRLVPMWTSLGLGLMAKSLSNIFAKSKICFQKQFSQIFARLVMKIRNRLSFARLANRNNA